jgi:large subunit ribosomal protein L6
MTRKQFLQEIVMPEGITARKEDKTIFIRGPNGEISKEFKFGELKCEIKEGKILISHPSYTRNDKRMINTITAHLKNMMKGAGSKFEYKLKVCASHFPINVEVKGNEVLIKNFLGEKTPRKCKIPKGAEVEVNKEIITVKSASKETAGQAAANFEAATKVRNRDRRVFQDGIYIISKNGREI